MQIFVSTLGGTSVSLEVNPNDTIQTAKARLQEQEKISMDEWALIFAGKELEDIKTFKDYTTKKDSALDLAFRLGKFDTFDDVKAKIERTTGVVTDQLRLSYGGRQIKKKRSIVDQITAVQRKLMKIGVEFGTDTNHSVVVLSSNLLGGTSVAFLIPKVLGLHSTICFDGDDHEKTVIHQSEKWMSGSIKYKFSETSSSRLLHIKPEECKVPFEPEYKRPCYVKYSNNTDNYVAYWLKSKNLRKFIVRSGPAVLSPQSTRNIMITLKTQKSVLPTWRRGKFILQSTVVNPGTTSKDLTPNMFEKRSGNAIEECKLTLSYIPPPQPNGKSFGIFREVAQNLKRKVTLLRKTRH